MSKTLLYTQLYESLRNQILSGMLVEGSKLPTEHELVEQFKISRVTVNKAMGLLVDEGLITRSPRNGSFVKAAGNLKKGFTMGGYNGLIGLIISSYAGISGGMFVDSVINEAYQRGFSAMLGIYKDSPSMEAKYIDMQIKSGAKGFVIIPHVDEHYNRDMLRYLIDGFPIVFADKYIDGISAPYVGSKNEEAVIQAANHLFELGHTHIAFATLSLGATSLSEREKGFLTAYAMTDFRYSPEHIIKDIECTMSSYLTPEYKRKDVERLKAFFTNHPEVTGLICSYPSILRTAEIAAAEVGYRIPYDISLLCFDAPGDLLDQDQYTHIIQNWQGMAEHSVSMLCDVLNGDTSSNHILLDTRLHIGRSTGPVSENR